jgi:hypothetical protein
MYCSFCDEILKGSIAGPGGKITDHLVTIRHIYHEATALCNLLEKKATHLVSNHLDDGKAEADPDLQKAQEYASKLNQWNEIVRFPNKNVISKAHIEDLLIKMNFHFSRLCGYPKVEEGGGGGRERARAVLVRSGCGEGTRKVG